MKKKLLIGVLMASMVLSASACGKKEVINVSDETKSVSTEEIANEEDTDTTNVVQKLTQNKENKKDKEDKENKEEATTENLAETTTNSEEIDKDENKEEIVSSPWEKMEFDFDGNTYKLPVEYSELEKSGWVIDWDIMSEEEKILPSGEITVVMLENDNYDEEVYVWANIANLSETDKNLETCTVTGFEVEAVYIDELAEKLPEMKLLSGITFGSTESDVIKAFGEADYIYKENGEYTSLEYTNEDSDLTMEIVIYDNIGVGEIMLSNDILYYEFLESHDDYEEDDYEEDDYEEDDYEEDDYEEDDYEEDDYEEDDYEEDDYEEDDYEEDDDSDEE